jgi:hypothetical protein
MIWRVFGGFVGPADEPEDDASPIVAHSAALAAAQHADKDAIRPAMAAE